jgi:hypothetical protein
MLDDLAFSAGVSRVTFCLWPWSIQPQQLGARAAEATVELS